MPHTKKRQKLPSYTQLHNVLGMRTWLRLYILFVLVCEKSKDKAVYSFENLRISQLEQLK